MTSRTNGRSMTRGAVASPLASKNGEHPPVVPIHARAIRVSLAPTMTIEGVEPMTVEPGPRPLVMLEASSGTGLLGGFAVEPPRDPPAGEPTPLVNGEPAAATLRHVDAEHARLEYRDGTSRAVLLVPSAQPATASGARLEVVVDGWRVEVELESAARAALRERAHRGRAEAGGSGPVEVRAIIPGVVVGVSVQPGEDVVAGQQLLAVEAMKMQNELRAPRDGRVERVAVSVGQTIDIGDLLLVIT